jgi:hypothetical protein
MAKAKAKKKSKGPRVKQEYLDPAMAPVSIPEIDEAADSYCEARDDRMEALGQEIERKEILKGLMKSHALTEYEYDSRIVTLKGEPCVRVKRKKAEHVDLDEDSD